MQVVKYFRHEIKDGKTYISARPDLQMIFGRDLWIDFQTEYGDVLDNIDADDGGMVAAFGVNHAQESYDLLSFFGYEERLNAEVILYAEVELKDIDVYGRNEAIQAAEVAAGIKPELLREMVWVEGAEDNPGVIVLPQDDYKRVYVLEGSRDNPTVRFVPEKNEAGGVRPYYEKPGDGKTYIYVDGFSGGSGTQEDPYLIHDVHELQAMKNNLNAHYALAQDIDASETVNWNNGAGFEPIGTSSSRFSGSFDGRGYKIIGLYINRGSTNLVGLFGHADSATIKNVGLVDGTIVGGTYTGGVVGYVYPGSVTHCYNTGSVTGEERVGGIVGYANTSVSISQCYNTGSVTGGVRVGGIVGYARFNASISHCYNTGSVTGGVRVGGIVGYADSRGSISQCYNTGSVTGGVLVGGIVGYADSRGSISQCYNTGSVTGEERVGGIVGYADSNASISHCYNTGSVTGEEQVGGICGLLFMESSMIHCYNTGSVTGEISTGGIIGVNGYTSNTVVYCYWNVETSGVSSGVGSGFEDGVFGKNTSEMMTQSTYVDWDFDDVWRIDEGNDYPRLQWQGPPGPIEKELRAPGIVIGLMVVGLVAPGIVQADVNIDRVAPGVVRGGIETVLDAPVQMEVRIRRRARAPLVVNPKIRRIRRWPLEIAALFWRRVPKPPSLFGGD